MLHIRRAPPASVLFWTFVAAVVVCRVRPGGSAGAESALHSPVAQFSSSVYPVSPCRVRPRSPCRYQKPPANHAERSN